MSEPVSNVVALPHGRIPPHNLDAECSLLGGILLDPTSVDDVLEIVHSSDFYRDAHRKIFEAIVDLAQRCEPVDRVQVKNKLTSLGMLDAAGGEEYVDKLDKFVPTASNLGHYAKIVAEKSLARRAIEVASWVAQMGYEQHGDVHEFVDQAEAKFFELRARSVKGEFLTVGELLKPVFKDIETRAEHAGKLIGLSSGLERLDDMTNGFKAGELAIIAARPSMGKSALATDIALTVAKAGGGVAFFSLEMTREALTMRMLSSVSGVQFQSLARGVLSDQEWGRLAAAAGALNTLPLHLFAKGEVSSGEVRAHSRRLAKKLAATPCPLKAILIDYLQLMYVDEGAERRDVAIGKNTRQLKDLAQQLGVPVILLAQLNRELEKRPDKRPRMADLRESGSIENDADLIIFVHRPEYYRPGVEELRGLAELIIGKQRNGATGLVKVKWEPKCMTFRDLYELPPEPEQMALPAGPPGEEPPPPEER